MLIIAILVSLTSLVKSYIAVSTRTKPPPTPPPGIGVKLEASDSLLLLTGVISIISYPLFILRGDAKLARAPPIASGSIPPPRFAPLIKAESPLPPNIPLALPTDLTVTGTTSDVECCATRATDSSSGLVFFPNLLFTF